MFKQGCSAGKLPLQYLIKCLRPCRCSMCNLLICIPSVLHSNMQVWSYQKMRSRSMSTLCGQETCACNANMRDEESTITHPLRGYQLVLPAQLPARDLVCCAELLLPAITRVAGIIGGVLLSLMLSVLLWPKSASEQAMRYVRTTCSPSQWLCTFSSSPSLHGIYQGTSLNTYSGVSLIEITKWQALCRACQH